MAAGLFVATFFVHAVGYLLRAPFWNDEEWVAISTRLPLHDLARDAASTPLGWVLLLRVMVFGGDQRYRLVPLVFAGLAAVAAYALARSLPWRSSPVAVLAGTLAGLVALLAPTSLIRDDLKQYTTDAFITLVLLWLLARLERAWSVRRFVQLVAVVVLAFLFSAPSAFVGASVLLSYSLVCLAQRQWPRLLVVCLGGAGAGLGLGTIYVLAYRPGVPAGLDEYWSPYYVPVKRGWGPSLHFLSVRLKYLAPYAGIANVAVLVGLFLAGILTLAWLRRPALALSLPLLIVEMILLSVFRAYPLGDERTSQFLVTAVAVTGALGVAGLCQLLARLHITVAVAGATAAAVVFVTVIHTNIRIHRIPDEDLRTPAHYVAANLRPGDVILLSSLSGWGFAYYWPNPKSLPHARPVRLSSSSNLQGFQATLTGIPDLVEASDRTSGPVADALADALADQHRNGPQSRIWLVREHVTLQEEVCWLAAFRRYDVDPDSIDGTRLMVITAS